MIIEVWEVYPEGSKEAVIFLDEDLARNQNLISPVELIAKAKFELSEEEMAELKALGYLWQT